MDKKHLRHIPAMCCELQPATLVILILRPEGRAAEAQGDAACHS